jgi:hypothetical protein
MDEVKLNRRVFIKTVACLSVALVGGYSLYEFEPWLPDSHQTDSTSKPSKVDRSMENPYIQLIRYATLAASGHNTQPWKFIVQGDTIKILPDFSRQLPEVDPDHRELWISLGCALENLLIAARSTGYAATVAYPDNEEVIQVELTKTEPKKDPLFASISDRQNTRSVYNAKPIPAEDFAVLQSLPVETGTAIHFYNQKDEMGTILNYVNQGNIAEYSNKAFVNELIAWIRFTKKEAFAKADGLFSKCAGSPEVPRWLGQLFVAGTKP